MDNMHLDTVSSFLPHNMKKDIIKPSHFTSTEHKKEQTDA